MPRRELESLHNIHLQVSMATQVAIVSKDSSNDCQSVESLSEMEVECRP
jgi:hypothetical protein